MVSLIPSTIKSRVILMISIPLGIELLMVASLFWLQNGYQQKLAEERALRDIVARTNDMCVHFTEGMARYADYGMFGGKDSPDGLRAQLEDDYEKLWPLIKERPQFRQCLMTAHAFLMEAVNVVQQYVRVDPKADLAQRLEGLRADGAIFVNARRPVDNFNQRAVEFEQAEILFRCESANEVRKTESIIDAVLLLMMLVSISAAVGLYFFFSRSMLHRLDRLLENTQRFAEGTKLREPLQGNDELSSLDTAFHKMATEITEAQNMKQQMISTISHDVRTPLAAISMFLELLTMGAIGLDEADDDFTSRAEKAEHDVNDVVSLITVLLDIEKINVGRLELSLAPARASDLVDRAIEKFNTSFFDDRIVFENNCDQVVALLDADRISQVLEYVIRCAVVLSVDGIVSFVSAQDADRITIDTTWSGAEMTPELIQSLNQGCTDTIIGAVALAIPLCHQIMDLHQGSMDLLSPFVVEGKNCFRLSCRKEPGAAAVKSAVGGT